MATFISNSPAETEAIGRQLAEEIGVGSVLALKGELGSGKTMFVKGLVAGLSVIEWADRLPELIPQQARWILFEIKSENQRAINVQGRAVSNSPFASGGLETAAS